MKKLIMAFLLSFLLSSCSNTGQAPEVAFKGTQVEELVDKPDRELLRKSPEVQYLKKGSNNGDVGTILSNNNLRSAKIERRLEDLQQYVCNLFKESVGEVCEKGK